MPTSLPAGVFTRASLGDESLELLRSLPLTMLYCGFVKYEVEGTEGVWMRTYGADRFGLPDFAALAEGHHQGEFYSNIFNNIMAYLLQSGAEMDAGHTMQIGENAYLKRASPSPSTSCRAGPHAGRGDHRRGPDQPAGRLNATAPGLPRRPGEPVYYHRRMTSGWTPMELTLPGKLQGAGTRGPGRQAHAPRAPGPQARERHASDRHDRPSPLHANLPRLTAYLDRVPGVRVLSSEVTPTPTGGSSSPSTSPIRWHGAWCRNWASC